MKNEKASGMISRVVIIRQGTPYPGDYPVILKKFNFLPDSRQAISPDWHSMRYCND